VQGILPCECFVGVIQRPEKVVTGEGIHVLGHSTGGRNIHSSSSRGVCSRTRRGNECKGAGSSEDVRHIHLRVAGVRGEVRDEARQLAHPLLALLQLLAQRPVHPTHRVLVLRLGQVEMASQFRSTLLQLGRPEHSIFLFLFHLQTLLHKLLPTSVELFEAMQSLYPEHVYAVQPQNPEDEWNERKQKHLP